MATVCNCPWENSGCAGPGGLTRIKGIYHAMCLTPDIPNTEQVRSFYSKFVIGFIMNGNWLQVA